VTRPRRRVALFGVLGCGNLGNDASFETVLDWLRTTHPETEVLCVTPAPGEVKARYQVPSVQLAAGAGPRWAAGMPRASKLLGRLGAVPRSLALARSLDAVVVPGMGVLEEALGIRPWSFPTWLFLMAAGCRVWRRPFVLLAVGAEPVVNPVTRRLFTATVNLATHVSYRDSLSAEAMQAAGARPPDVVAADLAFAHPTMVAADPEPGRVVIGVIAYRPVQDETGRGPGLRRQYAAAITEVIIELAVGGDHVVLIGGDRVDIEVAQQILAAVRAARPDLPDGQVTIRDATTFAELTAELARAEVVVASRFHNLIGALRLGRPTISVGYAPKSGHLMQRLGLDAYHQHLEDVQAGWLAAQLRSARTRGPALTRQISQGCRSYADEARELMGIVGTGVLGLAPARKPDNALNQPGSGACRR
jgi:polysaccharide pyruvyl transferase WcaK-like protein